MEQRNYNNTYSINSDNDISKILNGSLKKNRQLQKCVYNQALKLNSTKDKLIVSDSTKERHNNLLYSFGYIFKSEMSSNNAFSPEKYTDADVFPIGKPKWGKREVESIKKGIKAVENAVNIVNECRTIRRNTKNATINASSTRNTLRTKPHMSYGYKPLPSLILINSNPAKTDKLALQSNSQESDSISKIDFKLVSEKYVKTHTPIQCQLYWTNYLRYMPVKKFWTAEKEDLLSELAIEFGQRNWIEIALRLNTSPILAFMHFRKTIEIRYRKKHISDNILSRIIDSSTLNYIRFTKEEDQKILELAEQNGENCWADFYYMFDRRDPKSLKRRYTLLTENELLYNKWNSEKDLMLIKNHYMYRDNWKLLSSRLENTSEHICRKRFKLLERNKKNNIWIVGIRYDHVETNQDTKDFSLSESKVNIIDTNKKACSKEELAEFKRIYKMECLNFKNNIASIKKRSKTEYSWKVTLNYYKKYAWIFQNYLNPDPGDPNLAIKYMICKTYSSMKKRGLSNLNEYILNGCIEDVHYDKEFDFRYAYADSNQPNDTKSKELENHISELFGHFIFDRPISPLQISSILNEYVPKNTKNDDIPTNLPDINKYVAKTQEIMNKVEVSYYRTTRKRRFIDEFEF